MQSIKEKNETKNGNSIGFKEWVSQSSNLVLFKEKSIF
jgi:hypothetical protein